MKIRKEHLGIAAILTVLSTTSFTLSGFFSGPAISQFSFWQTLFFRFAIPLILTAPLYFTEKRRLVIEVNKLQIARALFLVTSQALFFITSLKTSLFEGIVLYNTGPVFILLIDSGYFRKRILMPSLIGVFMGFAGTLAVLWGGRTTGITIFLFTGLLSGIFFALSQFTLYLGSKSSSNYSILFHTYAYGTLFALLALLVFGRPIDITYSELLGPGGMSLVLMALCSLGNQWFRGIAYHYSPNISAIAPYLYFGILASAALDYIFRDKTPSHWAIIGALCIVVGSLISNLLKNSPKATVTQKTKCAVKV